MEDKREDETRALLGPAGPIGPSMIGQLRQLSVPLWARFLTLTLAAGTLLGGGFLVWQGWASCTTGCTEKWLENGTKIVGAAFVPAVVLVYLVFAETGVKALIRKTGDLLERTIPDALRVEGTHDGFDVAGDIERCDVITSHVANAPRARYRLTVLRAGETGCLDFVVDLNVSKANVVFFIPTTEQGKPPVDTHTLRERFRPTIEGAEHEGYVFDKAMPEATIGGQHFLRIVARRKLAENFLWDPGCKLHFAQDLRMFAHSVVLDGWDLLVVK